MDGEAFGESAVGLPADTAELSETDTDPLISAFTCGRGYA